MPDPAPGAFLAFLFLSGSLGLAAWHCLNLLFRAEELRCLRCGLAFSARLFNVHTAFSAQLFKVQRCQNCGGHLPLNTSNATRQSPSKQSCKALSLAGPLALFEAIASFLHLAH